MKYIDAEKLIAKIKELNLATNTYDEQVAFNNALAMVVETITSLQQEQQEVDLDNEMSRFIRTYFTKQEYGEDFIAEVDWENSMRECARHFYELGQGKITF